MKKLLKTFILIVVVLILLFIIAGVCLILFLDPNKFKGQISTAVHDKTGRELVINGDIERSFFPWLGLRIHQVRMSNAPGFEPQDNFITVGEADISVRLLPLLSGKVEIGKLGLKDLQLNLAENKQGMTNWQDLKALTVKYSAARGHASAVTIKSTIDPVSPTGTHTPPKFSVEGIDIQNAHITWVNQKNGQSLTLSNLDLSSQNIGLNKAFPLNLKFVLKDNKPQVTAQFSLDADVTLQPQHEIYSLGKLRLSGELLGKSLPKTQLQAESVVVNLKEQTLSIANALLSAANLTAKTNLEGVQILSKPQFNGRIDIAQFSLKDFLKAFGKTINTQDPEALQKAALSGNFMGDASSLKFSSISGYVDGSAVQGAVNITSFTDKAVDFALNINELNLDRYMPVKSAASASASAPTVAAAPAPAPVITTSATSVPSGIVAAAVASQPLPPDAPGNYNAIRQAKIDGSLQIGALTVAKTQLAQVAAHLSVKDGIVTVDPLTANVYQGTTSSRFTADLRGSIPRITIDEKLVNVQVNQLTKSDRLTGTANVTANLTLQGQGSNSLLRSLNGTTQFNIQKGALAGVDLPFELDRAAALIKKKPGPGRVSTGSTDFQQFSGSGVFKNGVFNNNDLLMQSSELKITGNGTANLVTHALNYHLSAEQPDNAVLGNTALPLLVTGTFSQPMITPDIEAVARTLLRSGIKTRLEEHIGGGRAGALLNLFLQR